MLLQYQNLIWGMSDKKNGSMKFLGGEHDKKIIKNRQKFFIKLDIDYDNVVSADLQHKNNVAIVKEEHAGRFIQKVDGLITNEKNLFLTVTVADCLPIYFYDPKKEIIGLAHAGWIGAVKNIAGKIIQVMVNAYQSNISDILVYIGHHIQRCHYSVKEDVADQFKEYKNAIVKKNNKTFIGLSKVVIKQLLTEAILKSNIKVSKECTYCLENKYFSYRRDKPKNIEAMIAYIGLNFPHP